MLQKLSNHIADCLARAAEARSRAQETGDPRTKAEQLALEQSWNSLARGYEFAESLDRFLYGGAGAADGWQPVSSAPFGCDLELAVIDRGGTHALVFPCRRDGDGWRDARTRRPIDVAPSHWREWLALSPGLEPGAGERTREERGGDAGLVIFADECADLRIERGDNGAFELVLRTFGEESTAYDLDRETMATIGRRLLSLAARN